VEFYPSSAGDSFDGDVDCNTYGTNVSAIEICIKKEDNELLAGIPRSLITD
jgi:hypothetical protein